MLPEQSARLLVIGGGKNKRAKRELYNDTRTVEKWREEYGAPE